MPNCASPGNDCGGLDNALQGLAECRRMCAPVFFTQPSTRTTRGLTTQPLELTTTAATTTASGAGNDLGGAGGGSASTEESSDYTAVFVIVAFILFLIAAIVLYVSIKTRGTMAFDIFLLFFLGGFSVPPALLQPPLPPSCAPGKGIFDWHFVLTPRFRRCCPKSGEVAQDSPYDSS